MPGTVSGTVPTDLPLSRHDPGDSPVITYHADALRVADRLGMRKLSDDAHSGRPVVIMAIDRPVLHTCNTGAISPQSS